MNIKTILHKLSHAVPLVLLGVALIIVHRESKLHNLHDIANAIHSMPWQIVAVSFGLMAMNYIVLAGYDALALRYTGHRNIPFPKIMLTSLISYAISNNTGHAWAAGGSIRYRFYTAWGVPGWDILKISLFLGLTYIVGVMTMGLGSTLLLPETVRENLENSQMITGMMIVCAVFLSVYWGGILLWRKPVKVRGVEVALPSPVAALFQTIVSCFDMLLAAWVLWVFLSGHVSFGFETFLVIFILAQLAGLLSQVPGGIGVFEGAFLWLLSGTITQDTHLAVVSALVLYRVIYYFVPLGVSGIGLLAYEMYVKRHAMNDGGRMLVKILSGIMPQILAILLLISGTALLLSGATPAVPETMHWLRGFIPLPVIEISHLLGSLTGLLLLFLARGIYLRLDVAWYGSLLLLGLGAATSLLKGFDWHEAVLLTVMLLLMLPTHDFFRRRSSLFTMPLSWTWVAMVVVALAGSVWVGFFAFRHVAYADELWWQFSYHDDAPRFLRALLLMSIVITGYILTRLMAVARPHSYLTPSSAELSEAAILVRSSHDTQAFLALLGDKKFFWDTDRRAFIMFADTPKYWIAMGNPVGHEDSFDSLLWAFREEADRRGVKIVFYEIGEALLPLFLDLGLTLLKIGEEAKVRLSDFNLEGSHHETQRKTRNKFIRQQYSFSILDRADVIKNLSSLRNISNQWLARKNTQEKSFSLGFFDEHYLSHMRVAVIRDPAGTIIAFANLWEMDNGREISVDMMRYDPTAPGGTMDFLFTELMLWAKAGGIMWFSLGMVPLSGLERHVLAPLWHKIGTAIYDLGEEFYNFEGLYNYKAKFDPVWTSRYLAAPAGFSAPLILMTVAKLVAGGWKGIFIK